MHVPIKAASSPSSGNNMHGLRRPFLSLHPPAKRIMRIPKTESTKKIILNEYFQNVYNYQHIQYSLRKLCYTLI